MQDSLPDRRNNARVPVSWRAECRLGGVRARGRVRDVSEGGVFFIADLDAGGIDWCFWPPGETVVLAYQPDWETRPRGRLVTVRWVGYSDDHDAPGAGLAFDRE